MPLAAFIPMTGDEKLASAAVSVTKIG